MKFILFFLKLFTVTLIITACSRAPDISERKKTENNRIINYEPQSSLNIEKEVSGHIKGVPVSQDYITNTGEDKKDFKEINILAKSWEFVPNRITLKKDEKVRFLVKSVDVEDGFYVPELGINKMIRAGETIIVDFEAKNLGVYDFKCSTYCGKGHSLMVGKIIIE